MKGRGLSERNVRTYLVHWVPVSLRSMFTYELRTFFVARREYIVKRWSFGCVQYVLYHYPSAATIDPIKKTWLIPAWVIIFWSAVKVRYYCSAKHRFINSNLTYCMALFIGLIYRIQFFPHFFSRSIAASNESCIVRQRRTFGFQSQQIR